MRDRIRRGLAAAGIGAALLAVLPGTVAAADGSTIDTGDTAWMLTSTALVMIMLPGLALFYGGLVRRKNVLSTIMHSFFGLAIVSIVWVLIGFTLAFGPDVGGAGLIGNLDYIGFNNVGQAPSTVYAVTIPFLLRSPSGSGSARSSSSRSFGRSWSIRRSPTGSGRSTAGCTSSARSTSRVGPWSTSARACRH